MSTVNERLRQQEVAMLLWLIACVKKLGGKIILEKIELDRLSLEVGQKEQLKISEEEKTMTLSLEPVPQPSVVFGPDGQPAKPSRQLMLVPRR